MAGVPADLAGILAGVADPDDFYAHHLGIQIGQIDGRTVQQTDTSSMFGLIHYIDPRYDDSTGPHPIATADLGAPYDFTVLTLKALFENSAIKKFDSLAQMVLNEIFGSAVTAMVDELPSGPQPNLYNAVLLEGGVQRNGDAVVYSLSSRAPNRYTLANNLLTSVEIDTAQMSTRAHGSASDPVVSWIGMSGFMNFAVIPAVPGGTPAQDLPAFDIFSFGPDPEHPDVLRQGLSFDNLGLQITIPPANGQHPPPTLAMIEAEIAFTTSASHPRKDSLLQELPARADRADLRQRATRGRDGRAGPGRPRLPTGSDPVQPPRRPLRRRGLARADVHPEPRHPRRARRKGQPERHPPPRLGRRQRGRQRDERLGRVRRCAAPRSRIRWRPVQPADGGQAVGRAAPADVRPPDPGGPAADRPGGFLLVLNEIALKLFGLLKIPPSGNTAFLLFGDPEAIDTAGLGWLAIYNQAKKADAEARAAPARAALAATAGS